MSRNDGYDLDAARYPSSICAWEIAHGIVRSVAKNGMLYIYPPDFAATSAGLDREKAERDRKEREEEERERREHARGLYADHVAEHYGGESA